VVAFVPDATGSRSASLSGVWPTRHYAETTAATLQRRFDQLTDPAVQALINGIRQQRGDEAALIAAELLARRRAERVSTAGA
jgi:integrase/recombinase XerD